MTTIKHVAAGLLALGMLTTSAMAREVPAGPSAFLKGHAAVAIAEHRIAAIEQGRVRGFRAGDEVGDVKADIGRAEIARQDHPGRLDRAALLDAAQQIGHQLHVEHPAADRRIARPVAEQRGGHGDDIDAMQLDRKGGGAVADMAECDL